MKLLNINRSLLILIIGSLTISISSCKKYLDKKSDQRFAIPKTLEDFELLLNNYYEMNESNYPSAAELLSDNFFWEQSTYESQNPENRNIYTWSKDDQTLVYWFQPYKPVSTCNIILEAFEENTSLASSARGMEIKARTIFFKSFFYLSVLQLYTPPYKPEISNQPNGIVLRSKSDFNVPSTRSTLKESYETILAGFKEAAVSLPNLGTHKSKPSKCAAYGALARTYLTMSNYDSANFYADKCLQIHDSLMDYNELDQSSFTPIQRFNKEVVFQMRSQLNAGLSFPAAMIDTNLMKLYSDNDLRKQVFFIPYQGNSYFKGDYDGNGLFSSGFVFSGIVTDEMYLIRSECLARKNDIPNAMKFLNKLLIKRWNKDVPYVEVTAVSSVDAVQKIITERRKELLFRGLRWDDLRRLQNDPNFAITPKRIINNQEYSLLPSSPRYALLIPSQVINQTNIPQNP